MKIINCFFLLLLSLLISDGIALAHKVNLFAYVEEGRVYTESYFPGGRIVEGGKVSVYDDQNTLLIEGTTDKQGLFSFDVPGIKDLNIVIDATMGHKNSFKLKKSELEVGQ